ncbi:hypothetical protein WI89_23565 [Burkholderia ubonensis]|nr:hypothetical protein WI89_23565 [Burkholderia ubonensis]
MSPAFFRWHVISKLTRISGVMVLEDFNVDCPDAWFILQQCCFHLLLQNMAECWQCLVDVR